MDYSAVDTKTIFIIIICSLANISTDYEFMAGGWRTFLTNHETLFC